MATAITATDTAATGGAGTTTKKLVNGVPVDANGVPLPAGVQPFTGVQPIEQMAPGTPSAAIAPAGIQPITGWGGAPAPDAPATPPAPLQPGATALGTTGILTEGAGLASGPTPAPDNSLLASKIARSATADGAAPPAPPAPAEPPSPIMPFTGVTPVTKMAPDQPPAPPPPIAPPPSPLTPPGAAAPPALPSAADPNAAPVTTFGPGDSLIGTQINPAASERLTGTQGAVDTSAATLAADPQLAAARAAASSNLDMLNTAPDRQALAAQSLQELIDSTEPGYQRQVQQTGQRAAAFGKLGSGMAADDVVRLGNTRQQEIVQQARELATETAGQTLQDRINKLNASTGTAGAFSGLDTGQLQTLSQLEAQQAGQEAAARGEVRGERAYQYGTSQDAVQQAANRKILEDQLLNSAVGRNVQVGQAAGALGAANNPAYPTLSAAEAEQAAGQGTLGAASGAVGERARLAAGPGGVPATSTGALPPGPGVVGGGAGVGGYDPTTDPNSPSYDPSQDPNSPYYGTPPGYDDGSLPAGPGAPGEDTVYIPGIGNVPRSLLQSGVVPTAASLGIGGTP